MTDSVRNAPGSYLVFDPGRSMGFAYCMAGGEGLRSGTWRFKQERYGHAYADFAERLGKLVPGLPDVQMGMELMTIVGHDDGKGGTRVDAKQVLFSSGWPAIMHTICYAKKLREPELIAIQTWRSKSHGFVATPKGSNMTQAQKSVWFKEKARAYCDRNKWEYDTPDEAEALCMLDYLRMEYEPGYAFDNGAFFEHNQGVLI